MAKMPAKNINVTLNAVAVEAYADNVSLDVTQELPKVTSFADAGPRVATGNYDWKSGLSGAADFAAGTQDATIFGLLGSAGVAIGLDPTGATAGASDPNYDGTVCLASYGWSGSVGGAVTWKAELQGNSALTRAVA